MIHHSNNDENYKASFNNTKHGRNYMNKDIFAYLAYRPVLKYWNRKSLIGKGIKIWIVSHCCRNQLKGRTGGSRCCVRRIDNDI